MIRLTIRLDFVVDQDVEVVWRALHSPAAAAELYGPFFVLRAVDPLPQAWTPGAEAVVQLRLLDLIPMGTQVIRADDHEVDLAGDRVRIFHDDGRPVTGPMALLESWDHRMAVNEVAGKPGTTRWRDRLQLGGPAALLFYPALWLTWQWRRGRIRRLAPTWR